MTPRYRIRLRHRRIVYLLGRVDPRTWIPGIRARRRRRRVAAEHATAVFHPVLGTDPDGLPAVEVAGVLVFAYLDTRCKALRVSIDLDTVQPFLLNDAERVPMLITVGSTDVFSADYPLRDCR